jgi:hypothetical protein
MKLTPPQKKVSDNPSRFRVVAAGRRFGKSFLSINELAKFSRYPNSKCLYVAPTYRQAKQVIWDELKNRLYTVKWIDKVNESDLNIRLKNGSVIFIRSADNREALRGAKYNFIVLDECADIHEETWHQILRPTLSDTGGSALFIGSPKGRNWFYDLYSLSGETDWQSWQFTTLEGGNVPASEIEAAKRDLDDRTFEQEYLSQFVSYMGVCYYSYTEDNVLPAPSHLPTNTPLHIGMDFNIDPMSAVVCVEDRNGDTWCIDEITIYSSNTNEMALEIKKRYGNRPVFVYPDATGLRRTTNSTGMSDHLILQQHGFKLITGKSNPPVAERISSVNARLCNNLGERKLFITPQCKQLREGLIKMVYKEGTRQPDKSTGHDHITDALGYYIQRTFPIKGAGHEPYRDTRRSTGRMI